MAKEIELREFAERVEDLCNFLLVVNEENDEADLDIIRDLKEDAADIQVGRRIKAGIASLRGLSDHMRGLPNVKEPK